MVPTALPCIPIWRCEECSNLGRNKEGDDTAIEALLGDSQHALDKRGVFGVPQGCITEERAHRSKPGVARTRSVVSVSLEVLEEGHDGWYVQMLQVERVRCAAGLGLYKAE